MNLIGKKVRHAKYGIGVIVNVNEQIIAVDFDGRPDSKFMIATLDKFLMFEDEEARNVVNELIQEIKNEKTETEAQEQAEKDRKIAKVTENIEIKYGFS